jgi:hypothetical protein
MKYNVMLAPGCYVVSRDDRFNPLFRIHKIGFEDFFGKKWLTMQIVSMKIKT